MCAVGRRKLEESRVNIPSARAVWAWLLKNLTLLFFLIIVIT
jgi:hypothetical protein